MFCVSCLWFWFFSVFLVLGTLAGKNDLRLFIVTLWFWMFFVLKGLCVKFWDLSLVTGDFITDK